MKEIFNMHRVRSDEGSVVILALLVLVILTLIGIGLLTSTGSDLMVSRNEGIYRQNFALAEAAAKIGAMETKNAHFIPIDEVPASVTFESTDMPYWMHFAMPVENNINDPNNWTAAASAPVMGNPNVRFLVRYDGKDGTLNATGSEVTYPYRYTIFGRSTMNKGEVIVQMGYILIMAEDEEERA